MNLISLISRQYNPELEREEVVYLFALSHVLDMSPQCRNL